MTRNIARPETGAAMQRPAAALRIDVQVRPPRYASKAATPAS
jgi:hypothetical protein